MEEDTQPLLISVGSDGERTLTNEHVCAESTSRSTSTKANAEGDLFQLERKRKEVERRIREIESREAHLRGTAGRGKRARTNESEGIGGVVANSEEPALPPKRRLLSSAVLPSQHATARLHHDGVDAEEEGRARKRAREGQDRGLYVHADKRRVPDGDERLGRGETEQRLVPAREGAERGRHEERERRQKEREEREKEWVKKAGGDATRNKRVFGVLLGTLQRFRKDQSAVAEKERVREQITKQVEEKVKEESELIVKEEERRLVEEKEKQQALRADLVKQIEEIQLSTLQSQWAVHHKLVANFRKTKAKPHICYTFNDDPLRAANEGNGDSNAVDSRRHRRDRDGNSGSESESSSNSDSDDESERDLEAKPIEEETATTEQRGGGEEDAGR